MKRIEFIYLLTGFCTICSCTSKANSEIKEVITEVHNTVTEAIGNCRKRYQTRRHQA